MGSPCQLFSSKRIVSAISDEDILALEKYYNEGKSPYVGYFFYKALCSKNKYFEAYNVYMELMKLQIKKKDINFYDVSKSITLSDSVR